MTVQRSLYLVGFLQLMEKGRADLILDVVWGNSMLDLLSIQSGEKNYVVLVRGVDSDLWHQPVLFVKISN